MIDGLHPARIKGANLPQLRNELGTQALRQASLGVSRLALPPGGWPSEQIAGRQQAQLPLEKKMVAANHVLWNDGDRLALAAQLDRLLSATALVEGGGLWPTDDVLEKLTGFPHRYFPNRLENPPGTLPAGLRA